MRGPGGAPEPSKESTVPDAPGTLYLVATPIGNLADFPPRALEALRQCDLVAAEDTRVTRKLLTRFQVSKPLVSYHAHNQAARGADLARQLSQGRVVALVSDAGAPCLSDPGTDLARLAWEAGCRVVPIPGPSAVVAALMASGLPASPFYFHGFLDPRPDRRRGELEGLKGLRATLVFFEAPHRLRACLADLLSALGPRQAASCRELTKLHEEIERGGLEELAARFRGREPRGEFTLVVAGAGKGAAAPPAEEWREWSLEEHLARLTARGRSLNEAIAEAARARGLDRREVYRVGHGLKPGRPGAGAE